MANKNFQNWFTKQNHGISFNSKEYKLAEIIWNEVELILKETKKDKKTTKKGAKNDK